MIPVSSISAAGRCSANVGALRWISHLSVSGGSGASPSIGSPRTLNIRPSVLSPTGTLMPRPSAFTVMPRERFSLAPSRMQRTLSPPICRATSMMRSSPRTVTLSASLILGRLPSGKLQSITGPDIAVILPYTLLTERTPPLPINADLMLLRLCARRNFGHLLSYSRLAQPVILQRKRRKDFIRILPRGAHCRHTRVLLTAEAVH